MQCKIVYWETRKTQTATTAKVIFEMIPCAYFHFSKTIYLEKTPVLFVSSLYSSTLKTNIFQFICLRKHHGCHSHELLNLKSTS